MLTATECLARLRSVEVPGPRQLILNQFIDDFRRADANARLAAVEAPIFSEDGLAALVAATVESLCVETDIRPPRWLRDVISPEPHFAFGAKSFPLRVRLMIDSPPAFKVRRVFVPSNFLERA